MDALTVRVERRPDAEPVVAKEAALDPDGIERSLGKMRRIIDQRPTR